MLTDLPSSSANNVQILQAVSGRAEGRGCTLTHQTLESTGKGGGGGGGGEGENW